jgi:hypothetical protein
MCHNATIFPQMRINARAGELRASCEGMNRDGDLGGSIHIEVWKGFAVILAFGESRSGRKASSALGLQAEIL